MVHWCTDGHLGSLYLLIIVNNAMSMFEHLISILLCLYLSVKFQGHVVTLTFWRTTKLFFYSGQPLSISIPTIIFNSWKTFRKLLKYLCKPNIKYYRKLILNVVDDHYLKYGAQISQFKHTHDYIYQSIYHLSSIFLSNYTHYFKTKTMRTLL